MCKNWNVTVCGLKTKSYINDRKDVGYLILKIRITIAIMLINIIAVLIFIVFSQTI